MQRKVSFSSHVLSIVRRIPEGEVLTYSEVARRAGSPKAFRAVGTILHKNHNPLIPCHRVIKKDGSLGGYNRGEEKKKELLHKEGIILSKKTL